uniref:methyltransferase n=1 Tax=uncultured Lentibacter sp. TaxID=1659309 RepID=UPI0026079288
MADAERGAASAEAAKSAAEQTAADASAQRAAAERAASEAEAQRAAAERAASEAEAQRAAAERAASEAEARASEAAARAASDASRREDSELAAAARRLEPKGYLTLICRAERLPELLAGLPAYLGSVELWPVLPRRGQPSQLVLLRARHSGRAAFRLHAGLLMHDGESHTADVESYTAQISGVLRDAAALPFPEI